MTKLPKMPIEKWVDIPPVWLFGFIVLAVLLPRAFPWLDPDVPWVGGLGGLLILIGFVLTVAALVAFRRAQTTPIPHQVPRSLITSGIFRYTRNPIYLGDVLFLSAVCLISGAWVALVIVPAFIFTITKRFILPEEDRLKRRFPDEFAVWSKETRRWM